MKVADRLIGKGLSFWVISQFILYSLAWMLVLVVPMSVLVATIMAFGSMSQNNEIAIMKASGISLYRMMLPPFLASIVIAFLLIQFNNNVYPDTNHGARILLQDISRQKPTLSLVPGVFSQEVKNYSILVREINPITNELSEITIYDNSTPSQSNVITAKSGKIYFSKDQTKLIMDLRQGEIHEKSLTDKKMYRRLIFDKHRIAMNGEQFSFRQSSFGGRRGERELGAPEMLVIVDSLERKRETIYSELNQKIVKQFLPDSNKTAFAKNRSSKRDRIMRIKEKIKSAKGRILATVVTLENNKKNQNKYWVEIHKKYSLPVACIIFILIGAPLGTMARKGGFGMGAGISLFFFLIYWFFLIGGEKLSDRGMLSPFWGMWSANILLGLLGIFLTIKAARERVTISFDFLLKLIPKSIKQHI